MSDGEEEEEEEQGRHLGLLRGLDYYDSYRKYSNSYSEEVMVERKLAVSL